MIKAIKTYYIKIILLGEAGVGKSNLINAYFDNAFNVTQQSTSTPNQSFKTIQINNKKLNISIWDTMGQEIYRSLTRSFILGSHIVLLVYDITRRETFLELNYWANVTKELLGNEKIIFGVSANKIDLFEISEVEKNEGKEFAQKIGGLFEETSGKADPKGFKDFIQKLLEKMLKNKNICEIIEQTSQNESNFLLEGNTTRKNKKCCLQ